MRAGELPSAMPAPQKPAIADPWVTDYITVPSDDAGVRGADTSILATLAFVAGVTTRVGLGTSVLVLD